MNPPSAAVYLNLIQQLLDCPNGEEGNILEANQNLLDETLIQIMLGVAQNAREENQENIADFLESLARGLVQWLTPVNPEDYFTFLQEVLQAEYESDSNPEVVYPLLKLNLEKLNPYFAQLLQEWARNVFSQSSPEDANTIAGVIVGFCNHLYGFPLGSRLDNLEIAITGHETVLEVYTREAFPVQWAMTQNNLGIAYRNRIKGERAENLEEAIAAFQRSLEVRTREAFPVQWATTQNNLGNAYSDRIKGERAENLEEAIAAFQRSLEVYTREAFPVRWAMTQNNLGTAYSDRIKGEKAENLEGAIAAFQRSLEVLTREAFPVDWSMTQNNLGNAYRNRIKGEKAENLEGAIAAYQLSLEVLTREAFPVQWAMTQNNLGNAYNNRIKGEKAENLEGAIAAYQLSLEVRTREAFPVDWATTQNNLGNTYRNRIKGEKAENLEGAIAAYQRSLEVFTREAFPVDFVRTRRNLGNLYFGENQPQKALDTYQKAVEVVETLRTEASTLEDKQEVFSSAGIDIFYNSVQAYLNLGQNTQALEMVERSKTRNLSEMLTTSNTLPIGDIPPDVSEQLQQFNNAIRSEQMHLDRVQRTEGRFSARTALRQLQTERKDFIDTQIAPIDPSFPLTASGNTAISYSDILKLVDDRTAILEWYITYEKILVFILTPSDSLEVLQFEQKDHSRLIDWFYDDYLNPYYDIERTKDKAERNQLRQNWIHQLPSRLSQLADILHLTDILQKIPEHCQRLILIPHRFLHLLPLHACDAIFSRFPQGISYVPSCTLLDIIRKRQRSQINNFLSLDNPTKDLHYTTTEITKIKTFFLHADTFPEDNASKANLITYPDLNNLHCLHFSCHGKFNFTSPLESALTLSDDALKLGDVFELALPSCRLVTLSACETGLSDLTILSDEYVSLASGFIFAGSNAVVSSLWAVEELAKAIFMIEFYRRFTQGEKVEIALKATQQWLKTATKKTLIDWVKDNELQLDNLQKEQLEYRLLKNPDSPFNNIYYWGAFAAIGE